MGLVSGLNDIYKRLSLAHMISYKSVCYYYYLICDSQKL